MKNIQHMSPLICIIQLYQHLETYTYYRMHERRKKSWLCVVCVRVKRGLTEKTHGACSNYFPSDPSIFPFPVVEICVYGCMCLCMYVCALRREVYPCCCWFFHLRLHITIGRAILKKAISVVFIHPFFHFILAYSIQISLDSARTLALSFPLAFFSIQFFILLPGTLSRSCIQKKNQATWTCFAYGAVYALCVCSYLLLSDKLSSVGLIKANSPRC